MQLNIQTPRWAIPLVEDPERYKYQLVKGGRMSGKSHTMAENVVELLVANPDKKVVCIREIQKSLKFSAKALIDEKIESMGVGHMFEVLTTEIRRKGGNGMIIFQGMQDHTADSIKSLEGFDVAWVEEAQSLSERSLKLLRPTIMRKAGAQIWASWNPDQEDDAIEKLARALEADKKAAIIHVNYNENPFLNEEALEEIEADKLRYPEDFDHVYLGGYNLRAEARVFKHWSVEECEPRDDDVLYYGADWGFAKDPTVLIRGWYREEEKKLYIDYEAHGVGVEIDHNKALFNRVPGADKWPMRADSARPETISYMKREGFNIKGCKKYKGSVEDGVEWLRAQDIIVHPRCELVQKELRLYSYQEDKAGNILPKLEDDHNHCIDAMRYAFEPLIKPQKKSKVVVSPVSTRDQIGTYI